MRSIVISIKSICFSYGWIQLLKLVSLLPVQFSNKRIICSNRKKVLHMLFIRNLYVFRLTVYSIDYRVIREGQSPAKSLCCIQLIRTLKDT